jgi:hypothetical protein
MFPGFRGVGLVDFMPLRTVGYGVSRARSGCASRVFDVDVDVDADVVVASHFEAVGEVLAVVPPADTCTGCVKSTVVQGAGVGEPVACPGCGGVAHV